MRTRAKLASVFTAVVLLCFGVGNLVAQQPQAPVRSTGRLRVSTEIVLVNVIARDKHGNWMRDLKREDFTVFEDGKKQDLASFDFEKVDELATAGGAGSTVTGTADAGGLLNSNVQKNLEARDRRLMLMFFDFSAMEPDDIDRSVEAGKKYVQAKMQPADMVALMSLATNLKLDLDFTDDKAKILATLSSYNSSEGQGFENGSTGSSEGAAETSGSYTPDDTDYNTFSADRKLLALESVMQAMGKIPQKKSLIYFSNGISQSGVDNQSALRTATAAAVRAAARNRLQASINLALGSAVASIGLAVPAVALVSSWIGQPLELGISAGASVLMALGFVVAIITYGTGRTNLLSGIVHLVLLATYVFTVFAP